jgi:beta-lactamase class A
MALLMISVLWSPLCKPIILAIYTVQNKESAKSRDDIVAVATTIVMNEFSKNDPCFKALFS